MIAVAEPAPLRKVRLNRRNFVNSYELKARFVALCAEHSVRLVTVIHESDAVWSSEKNHRRCLLIDRSLQGKLTEAEEQGLSLLQRQAEAYFDEVAPPPIDGALKIHAELLKLAKASKE